MAKRTQGKRDFSPPTRDEQIARYMQIIDDAQRIVQMLRRLPTWAVVRKAGRVWLCNVCVEQIAKGDLHVEDTRHLQRMPGRQFIQSSDIRLCLECAPRSLAEPVTRRIHVVDEGGSRGAPG